MKVRQIRWKKEGFRDFDVPGIVEYMVACHYLSDASAREDEAPDFILGPQVKIKGCGVAGLVVRHPIRSFRKADDDLGRFLVYVGPRKQYDTDDLEEALSRVIEVGHLPSLDEISGAYVRYLKSVNR